jgi:hypothetical protein
VRSPSTAESAELACSPALATSRRRLAAERAAQRRMAPERSEALRGAFRNPDHPAIAGSSARDRRHAWAGRNLNATRTRLRVLVGLRQSRYGAWIFRLRLGIYHLTRSRESVPVQKLRSRPMKRLQRSPSPTRPIAYPFRRTARLRAIAVGVSAWLLGASTDSPRNEPAANIGRCSARQQDAASDPGCGGGPGVPTGADSRSRRPKRYRSEHALGSPDKASANPAKARRSARAAQARESASTSRADDSRSTHARRTVLIVSRASAGLASEQDGLQPRLRSRTQRRRTVREY